MLSPSEIRGKLVELESSQLSVEEFEGWFRDHALYMHTWPKSEALNLAVAIETVFSEYHFADLDDASTVRALAALAHEPALVK